MKAWEMRCGELGLHDVEPSRPRTDEVLVHMRYAGICGSDLPKLMRPTDFALPKPWRPGHEIVGVGEAQQSIAVNPLVSCARCARCGSGDIHLCPHLRRLGWDLPGGFAELVLAPAKNIHMIPEGLAPLHAVLADPAAVAIHSLRCSPIGMPERLAIVGAGTLGLLTALYAHDQGWTVTVVHRDGRPPQATATQAIPATFRSPSNLTKNGTFDVVVDAAAGSNTAPLELALDLVRDGGTVMVQNAYHPNACLRTPLRNIFRRSIRLIGSFSYCRRAGDDFARALAFLRQHPTPARHLAIEAGHLSDLPRLIACRPTSTRQVIAVEKP